MDRFITNPIRIGVVQTGSVPGSPEQNVQILRQFAQQAKEAGCSAVCFPEGFLTGYDPGLALIRHFDFAEAAQNTAYYRQIIPAMVDYYETAHYVFVHGWIPCIQERDGNYSHRSDWREATPEEWRRARWCNGMDAAQACTEEKTILCGHWHCSYGHARYENKGSEFGPDADFSPYYGPGVIALDACTAYSGKVNILILDD
jgi:hypothetical protein